MPPHEEIRSVNEHPSELAFFPRKSNSLEQQKARRHADRTNVLGPMKYRVRKCPRKVSKECLGHYAQEMAAQPDQRLHTSQVS